MPHAILFAAIAVAAALLLAPVVYAVLAVVSVVAYALKVSAVAAPFVLAGLGIYWYLRRRRKGP